ncbi:NUDIX hydrolase [Streptomyces sp. NPDC050844]|uniref:nucleotide triphosphate diphosphatase NUDT15 n=1 Tax=Streptomyces sp. NPDC050844 TaxID=3155790 RepID=UPI0033F711E1
MRSSTSPAERPERPERPERAFPTPHGLVGVGVVVLDASGRVLLGLGHDGRWELPGGKVDPGESFEVAAVRELAEETGLSADAEDVRIGAFFVDGERGVTRVTAGALVTTASGAPARVREPDKIERWSWFAPRDVPSELFAPSAAVLHGWRPELGVPSDAFHRYPTAAG